MYKQMLFLYYYFTQLFPNLFSIHLVTKRNEGINTTLTKYLPKTAHGPPSLWPPCLPPVMQRDSLLSTAHSPSSPELLPQLLLGGERIVTVLLHKGDIGGNHSLGTALHKTKHLLLGWRVKVIKKDTPNAPPLPTMGYKKVIVTPGKHSKAESGPKGRKGRHEHFSLEC